MNAEEWVLVQHLESRPATTPPGPANIVRDIYVLPYACISSCYPTRAAAISQARKDWPRSQVHITHCLDQCLLTRDRLYRPTDHFPIETIACSTQAVLAIAISTYMDHHRLENMVFIDSRRPCIVTFCGYDTCLHSKSLHLSCEHTLQPLYTLHFSVFVDAHNQLSDLYVTRELTQ